MGRVSPSGRRCWKRSTPAPSTTATPAMRRRSSRKPPTPRIQYAAAIPTRGYGQAIVVPAPSPIKTARRSQGQEGRRRQGLERAQSFGLGAGERRRRLERRSNPSISRRPTPLPLSGAAPIDAWSIWDPFFAIAELKQNARPLPIDPKATHPEQLFPRQQRLSQGSRRRRRRDQRARSPRRRTGRNRIATKRPRCSLQASGVDLAAQKRAVGRAEFGFGADDRDGHRRAAGGRRPLRAPRPDPRADQRSRHRLVLETQRLTGIDLMSSSDKPLDHLSGSSRSAATAPISAPTKATAPPISPISSRSRRPPTGSASAAR